MNSEIAPGIKDVERITEITDPVIRNLQITQCYYELSTALAGKLKLNSNWCTFATWASKQAGQTIRKEDLLIAARRLIESSVDQNILNIILAALQIGSKLNEKEILDSIWKALNITSIDRASEAVAKGNKKVFEEIGFEFARFISLCLKDEIYNGDNIQNFCSEFKSGFPPDGQQYLQEAFNFYYKALFEPDNKRKAELMLLANLEVGFHEQTRLQPEIAASLNAAVMDPKEFRDNLFNLIFPSWGWLNKIKKFFLWLFGKLSYFDSAIEPFVNTARSCIRLVITEYMMTITFPPDLSIKLGEDLKSEFPAALKIIEDAELLILLKKIDPTPDSLSESGALDWADLPDRMHFICDMFRCYQQSENLFKEPFTLEQVARLKEGFVPEGAL